METNDAEKTWGGRRTGSGRKKTNAKTIWVGIPQDVADILAEVQASGIKQSDYIVAAIRHYHQHQSKD